MISVDNSLANSLIQAARSGLELSQGGLFIACIHSRTEPTDGSAKRATNRLIALPRFLVRLIALDLRLNVRHAILLSSLVG